MSSTSGDTYLLKSETKSFLTPRNPSKVRSSGKNVDVIVILTGPIPLSGTVCVTLTLIQCDVN